MNRFFFFFATFPLHTASCDDFRATPLSANVACEPATSFLTFPLFLLEIVELSRLRKAEKPRNHAPFCGDTLSFRKLSALQKPFLAVLAFHLETAQGGGNLTALLVPKLKSEGRKKCDPKSPLSVRSARTKMREF